MKTALVHYWLNNMRGGENVLAEFCRMFPDADIFTHSWEPTQVDGVFSRHRVTESFIARLPLGRRLCRAYLPLMGRALKNLDMSPYDFILSSESGPAKGVLKRHGALHVCYCHTPMRYIWDMYEDYYQAAGLAGKAAMRFFRDRLRCYDLWSAEGVDHFIANSRFVAERIRRIYGRSAEVVYPPVDVDFFSESVPDDGERAEGIPPGEPYYIFVGQLVSYKAPDLAVEACCRMNRRLIVVGGGVMASSLRRMASENVLFVGSLSREPLRRLYAGARALLFPGVEDFGIVPVEAQAAGCPVIALGQGGALETVRDGETGIFFHEQSVDSLCGAMERFEGMRFDRRRIQEAVVSFSTEKFHSRIREALGRLGVEV